MAMSILLACPKLWKKATTESFGKIVLGKTVLGKTVFGKKKNVFVETALEKNMFGEPFLFKPCLGKPFLGDHFWEKHF